MSDSTQAPSGRAFWVAALLFFYAATLAIPFLFDSEPGFAGLPGWLVALVVLQLVFAAAVWMFVRAFWTRESRMLDEEGATANPASGGGPQ